MQELPEDFVVVGLGQLGTLFAEAALRLGIRVTPVLRTSPRTVYRGLRVDTPVLVAVGEADLEGALDRVAAPLRDDVILVQNELFPADWQAMGVGGPTLVVFWSNRKRGQPLGVGRRTLVAGRHAALVHALHDALDLPCEVSRDPTHIGEELVAKYAFILTINALALSGRSATLGEWLRADPDLVDALSTEGVALGAANLGEAIDAQRCRAAVLDAMRALDAMGAGGRSARDRIQRATALASGLGLAVPHLDACLTT